MKDTGNIFVNLGDSYWGGKGKSGSKDSEYQNERHNNSESLNTDYQQMGGKGITRPQDGKHQYLQPKSLCCIPSRFAYGMIEHGWILRNEIIWHKLNSMLESVQDRWKKSHEMVYFFTKQQKNYFDLDAIRKPLATSSIKRISQPNVMNQTGGIKQEELRGNPKSGNASRCNLIVQGLAKKYSGKFTKNDNPEIFGSPRARTQRLNIENNGANDGTNNKEPYKQNNPLTIRLKGTEYDGKWKEDQEYLNHLQQRMNDARSNGIPHDEALNHPNGKNPGDVYTIDEEYSIEDIINTWKEIHPEDWNIPEDVWTINTRPYSGSHFAVFPLELVKDSILAGCPEQVCIKCGKPREKIFETIGRIKVNSGDYKTEQATGKHGETSTLVSGYQNINEQVGYSDCGCNAGFKSGTVLDPFSGSGTVGEFCKNNNRNAILFELNPEYKLLIDKRTYVKPKPKSLFE